MIGNSDGNCIGNLIGNNDGNCIGKWMTTVFDHGVVIALLKVIIVKLKWVGIIIGIARSNECVGK